MITILSGDQSRFWTRLFHPSTLRELHEVKGGTCPLKNWAETTAVPHRQQEEKKCNEPDVQDEKRRYDGENPVAESLHTVLAEGFIGQVSVEQHGVWTLLHRA